LPIYIVICFTRKKFVNFNKFILKCESNEIKYIIFISSSGSRTVINYGSGSDFLTSSGSTTLAGGPVVVGVKCALFSSTVNP
jgi:hypothetical protein